MASPATKMKYIYFMFILSILSLCFGHIHDEDQSHHDNDKNSHNFGVSKHFRYLLYDVNVGEGFNLRRDVYLRVANLVKLLNQHEQWMLVLPPWGQNYHWRSNVEQSSVPWATFFDIESLRRHVPVIEFSDFLKVNGPSVDQVLYLQRFSEGWRDGKWEERIEERDCIRTEQFQQDPRGAWAWHFWGHDDVVIQDFKCVSIQAQYSAAVPYLLNTTGSAVFLVHAEELIHGSFSEWSPEWWTARRSMIFAAGLRKIADDYRMKELGSTDEHDGTIYEDDWRQMQRVPGSAYGGPYLAVHLRRKDFVRSHNEQVPSLSYAAQQIQAALEKHKLQVVFIATDGKDEEFKLLKGYLSDYKVTRFRPSADQLREVLDGGVAIIDQWICAHARYFLGSYVSTFSFRIQEEREIMGFQPDTTFNRLCGDAEKHCEQPTKWPIKYGH